MAAAVHGLIHRDLKAKQYHAHDGVGSEGHRFRSGQAITDAGGEMDLTQRRICWHTDFVASPEQFGSGPVDARSTSIRWALRSGLRSPDGTHSARH